MLIFKTQILQFRLDREETQTMRQRSIQIKSLTRDLKLLGGKHGTQSPHIMKTVCDLD